jgi:hypothetical protein
MTNAMLLEKLNAEGINMDRDVLSKLLGKVYRERIKRADRQTLNYALASFEDTMTEVVRVAWEIAKAPYVNPQARVMALREVREAHNMVFEKLFDAGVFERKLSMCCGLAPRLRVNPMPPRITQKSCRPRVSHRIMVGTLANASLA